MPCGKQSCPRLKPRPCECTEKMISFVINRNLKQTKIHLIPCECLMAKNNVKKSRVEPAGRSNDSNYIQHLVNLCKTKAIVDNKPPRLILDNILKSKKIEEDLRRLKEITKENKILLKKINYIQRTRGVIDSYNKQAGVRKSKLGAQIKKIAEYEKDNIRMYFRILQVKPECRALNLENDFRQNILYMQAKCQYPICLPGITEMMRTGSQDSVNLPARPRVFIEFCIEECIPLGKVICTIYSDLVPIAADHFLSLLTNHYKKQAGSCLKLKTYKTTAVPKIYTNSHAEFGDCTKFGYGEDAIPVDDPQRWHTEEGIISMVAENNMIGSKFIITFAKKPAFDSTHIVIGKVIGGLNILKKLEGCGTYHGKPKEKVFISNCGCSIKSGTSCN